MVISPRNKKGDVTISTVILIVLGLAVLVMLIVGFTKGWSFFFDLFDSGPSQLQQIAKACVGYAQGSLTIDFCKYRLVKIDGNNVLLNCRYSDILTSLGQDDIDTSRPELQCSGNDEDAQKAACASLASGKPETKIDQTNCGVVNPQVTPPATGTATGKAIIACTAGADGKVNNAPCKCGTGSCATNGKTCTVANNACA